MATTITAILLGCGVVGSFMLLRRSRTNAKREREFLRIESEHKYSNLFNTVSDCIYIHTVDGILLEVNESVAQLLDRPIEYFVGKHLTDIFGISHQPQVEEYLGLLLLNKSELHGIVPLILKTSSRIITFEYRSNPIIQNGAVVRIQGIARDVTEQKKYERSLRRSEVQTKRLLEHATVMKHNLEIVSREMLKVQEEERVKISRELHDEIGQLLATMTVKLALIKKAFNGTTEGPLQVKLGETEVLAGEMFGRIRRFLKELRPVGLTQNGLVSAVKRLIREYSENTEIDTKFLGEVEALNLLMDETKTVVFRVIQESLTNITKHADATLVTLEVKKRRNSVQIKIVDNGIGFDVTKMNSTAVAHRGMGLIGMAERVKLVGGEFQLTSKVDIGTTIEVTIPLPGSLAGT